MTHCHLMYIYMSQCHNQMKYHDYTIISMLVQYGGGKSLNILEKYDKKSKDLDKMS